MPKKYSRRQFGSLDELDQAQAKLKLKAKQIESDWIQEIFNPQQLAIGVISRLMSKKKTKSSAKSSFLTPTQKAKSGNAAMALDVLKQPAVKRVAKKIGMSFVRWQVFNLAWFLGKKIIKSVKEKKGNRV